VQIVSPPRVKFEAQAAAGRELSLNKIRDYGFCSHQYIDESKTDLFDDNQSPVCLPETGWDSIATFAQTVETCRPVEACSKLHAGEYFWSGLQILIKRIERMELACLKFAARRLTLAIRGKMVI
jgi:hypothetical protein